MVEDSIDGFTGSSSNVVDGVILQAQTERPHLVYIFTVSLSVGFVLDSLRYFLEAGFDISVISSPGEELEEAARLGATTYAVPIQRTPAPLADLKAVWKLYRLLLRIRPDITNVGTPKAALVGGLAAVLARVPHRVCTMHGLRLETSRGRARQIFWWTEWIACRCAHQVLCVSASLRERMISLKLVSPDKAIVLGRGSLTGIDTKSYAMMPESAMAVVAIRKQLGIELGALVIGFVGRLVRDKGVVQLYEAFAAAAESFPTARLLLVGNYEAADPVPVETRQSMEQDARVICTGWQKNVVPYYGVMNVFALPSHREGLPTVLLEAQASGLPVAACYATGIVDAVSPDVTALLTPVGDAAALCRSLATLLSDQELRKRLGDAGREWVQEHFASEAAWKRLEAYYRRLLQADAKAS